jgi:hypothetical protein
LGAGFALGLVVALGRAVLATPLVLLAALASTLGLGATPAVVLVAAVTLGGGAALVLATPLPLPGPPLSIPLAVPLIAASFFVPLLATFMPPQSATTTGAITHATAIAMCRDRTPRRPFAATPFAPGVRSRFFGLLAAASSPGARPPSATSIRGSSPGFTYWTGASSFIPCRPLPALPAPAFP